MDYDLFENWWNMILGLQGDGSYTEIEYTLVKDHRHWIGLTVSATNIHSVHAPSVHQWHSEKGNPFYFWEDVLLC